MVFALIHEGLDEIDAALERLKVAVSGFPPGCQTHGGIPDVSIDSGGIVLYMPVGHFNGKDAAENAGYGLQVRHAFEQTADIIQLLDDFDEFWLSFLVVRDAGSVRGESRQFVAQDVIDGRNPDGEGLSVQADERAFHLERFHFFILRVFVQHVQKDALFPFAVGKVGNIIMEFLVGFRDVRSGLFPVFGFALRKAEVFVPGQILFDIRPGRADYIHVYTKPVPPGGASNSIRLDPPFHMYGQSACVSISTSEKARITFSIRFTSGYLRLLFTCSIHSLVKQSFCIIARILLACFQ